MSCAYSEVEGFVADVNGRQQIVSDVHDDEDQHERPTGQRARPEAQPSAHYEIA
jgi:hypothetical protein